MIPFLTLCSKRSESINPNDCAFIEELAAIALPISIDDRTLVKWKSPTGATVLFRWVLRSSLHQNPQEQISAGFAQSGYVIADGAVHHDDSPSPTLCRRLADASDADAEVLKLGGAFHLLLAEGDHVRVWTSISNLYNVFWAENSDWYAIGNRAMLVHLAAERTRRPIHSLKQLSSLIASRWLPHDLTAYERVNSVEANSRFECHGGRITCSPLNSILSDFDHGDQQPSPSDYDELCHEFMQAALPAMHAEGPVAMGVTGGKDSRLMAACLHRAGVPIVTHTRGMPDHPDVVVGTQIAAILNVPHQVTGPKPDNAIGSLGQWAVDSLYMYDGARDAWSHASRQGHASCNTRVTGYGGELLRGGYLKGPLFAKVGDQQSIDDAFHHLFFRFDGLLNEEYRRWHRGQINGWIQRHACARAPAAILDKFYLVFRCGRYAAASQMAESFRYRRIVPFCDNRLLQKVFALPPEVRSSERLAYELLKRINPTLAELPFGQKGWRFQKQPQVIARVSRVAEKCASQWKYAAGTLLKGEILEVIRSADARNRGLFELVNESAFDRMVNSTESMRNFNIKVLWSVYSAAMLLTGDGILAKGLPVIAPNLEQMGAIRYPWHRIQLELMHSAKSVVIAPWLPVKMRGRRKIEQFVSQISWRRNGSPQAQRRQLLRTIQRIGKVAESVRAIDQIPHDIWQAYFSQMMIAPGDGQVGTPLSKLFGDVDVQRDFAQSFLDGFSGEQSAGPELMSRFLSRLENTLSSPVRLSQAFSPAAVDTDSDSDM
jgi:hypothetical protein